MKIHKKRSLAVLCWAISAILFLSGCNIQTAEATHSYQVVTAIHIRYQKDSIDGELLITEENAVETILEYLQSVSPYGAPTEDPNQVEGSHYYITLLHSDGSRSTYHQLADRMMQRDSGPWKRIDAHRGQKLAEILGNIYENDFIPGTTPAPPLLRPELRG